MIKTRSIGWTLQSKAALGLLAAALAASAPVVATDGDGAQDPGFGINGVGLADLSSFRPDGLGAAAVATSPIDGRI